MNGYLVRCLTLMLVFSLTMLDAISAESTNSNKLAGKITVLKAARLLDVRAGIIINNPIVIISGERIISAGKNLTIPPDAQIIDLGDVTLLPGLVDSHTHLLQNLSFSLSEIIDESGSMVQNISTNSVAKRVLLGAAMGREDLEAGITTVRDLGNSGINGDIALRDAINLGWVQGPRIAASTRALSAAGGQFEGLSKDMQSIVDQEYAVVSGVEEARKAVRAALFDGANQIKVIVDTGPRVLSLEEMQIIVAEAHRADRPVAAHATTEQATAIAAQAGVNSIEHAYSISDDVLKMMVKKGIFLVPTDFPDWFYLGKNETELNDVDRKRLVHIDNFTNHSRDRLKRAIAIGVKIAFGSDAYYKVPGLTRGTISLLPLRTYIEAGMSPLDVIRTATIGSSELIGWQDRIGTIEAGKFADIIAVPGNPLDNERLLEQVSFVMKGGKIVKQ
jgi:imidazolonepropionase-like amidohydrolase